MMNATNKWHVSYNSPIDYDIISSYDIFDPQNETLLFPGKGKNSRRFVVVDYIVHKLYSAKIKNYFKKNGILAKIVPFTSGEKNKSIDNYVSILRELNSFPIDRRSEPIIAIGGGVLTDVIGFVAGSYRRGIPRINVPTTLMGYVDAAIGVKTGINFDNHKNRVGAFAPPQKVILDRLFLKTLPIRHILNGIGEIVKLAVIKDIDLFEHLETHGLMCIESNFQDDISMRILERSITGMIEELQPNLLENNLARPVDFGHTFSLAFEQQTNCDILHGEAVIMDVAISSVLANIHGLLAMSELNRILDMITKLNLPVDHECVHPKILWQSVIERTYHRGGLQRIPLPCAIGKCVIVNDIQLKELYSACASFKRWVGRKDAKIRQR